MVVAPQGAGKNLHAQALCDLFGCTTVVDEWDGVSPVPEGALVLATPHVVPGPQVLLKHAA